MRWRAALVSRGLALFATGTASLPVLGCSIGRQYDAMHDQRLIVVDPRQIMAQPQRADGKLPAPYCREACGSHATDCYVATVGVLGGRPAVGDPAIGAPILHCYEFIPAGSDLIPR